MRKKNAFSLLEILVVIVIIALISGVAIFSLSNKKRVVLKSDAEKIFNFLKNVQAQATKVSPVILGNTNNQNIQINLPLNLPDGNRPANGFFEMRTYRMALVDIDTNNINLQRLPNLTFNEIDKNVNVGIDVRDNRFSSLFFSTVSNSYPISMVCVFLVRNQIYYVGFRTNGVIAVPENNQGMNRVMNIRVSMSGLNRRHRIEIPNNSIRFEIYSERNN